MIYAHDTDWAGLGQFLVGLAAVLAIIINMFNRKTIKQIHGKVDDARDRVYEVTQTVDKVEQAVNKRTPGGSTVSEDVAEARTASLDIKDTLAKMNETMEKFDAVLRQGVPALRQHLGRQDGDLREVKGQLHRIQGKVETLGELGQSNKTKIDTHLRIDHMDDRKKDLREEDTGEGG